MLDLMKKALYTGLGMAVLTKDKLEEVGKELIRQAKLSEHEGKELLDDLMTQSEQARADLERRIQDAVGAAVTKMNLATKSQVDALAARVEALEKRIGP